MFENDRRVIAKIPVSAISGLCTCLQANMVDMPDDPVREDWPLGPALRRARELAGLSVREAARRTAPPGGKPLVSSGRWYQLESGWQKNKDMRIPVGTTAATVAAVARAVGWDPAEALELAGFEADDLPDAPPKEGLEHVSDDDLLAELAWRLRERLTASHAPDESVAAGTRRRLRPKVYEEP